MSKIFLLKIFAVWLFFILLLAPGIYCAAMTSYLKEGLSGMYLTLGFLLLSLGIVSIFFFVIMFVLRKNLYINVG